MDKIKLGLFDLFVYILPGSIILLSLDLVKNPHMDFIENLFNRSKDYTLFQVALLLSVSYLLGFVNQFLSYEFFKVFSKFIWKKRLLGKETSIGKLEDKIVMIRHFSPENFSVLNTWLALRGMCYSLFTSSVFLFFISLKITIQFHGYKENWFDLLLIAIFSILFLRRSVTFHEWVHGTINHSTNNMNHFNK